MLLASSNVWARPSQGSYKNEGFGDFCEGCVPFMLDNQAKSWMVDMYAFPSLTHLPTIIELWVICGSLLPPWMVILMIAIGKSPEIRAWFGIHLWGYT